jgi:hypothetical protein
MFFHLGNPNMLELTFKVAGFREVEVHDAYLASIEPFKEGGGYAVPGEFVVARGVY